MFCVQIYEETNSGLQRGLPFFLFLLCSSAMLLPVQITTITVSDPRHTELQHLSMLKLPQWRQIKRVQSTYLHKHAGDRFYKCGLQPPKESIAIIFCVR